MADCYSIRTRMCRLAENRIQECKEARNDRLQVCSQLQDNGYNQCAQWNDAGHTACGAWDKNCCTWAPCSWACKVVTWICAAWVWVSNWVCRAVVWFTNRVCVAWAWVTYVVCVAWVTIVLYTCIALSWVTYWVCRLPETLVNVTLRLRMRWIAARQCRHPRDTERNPLEREGWKLSFQDDFDQGAIDTSKWQDLPYFGLRYFSNNLQAGGVPSVYLSPANFAFGPTTVKLIADKQPTVITNDPNASGPFTIPYTAGYLEWKAPLQQLHGYFEIRCKIPGTPYQWPAFWLASRAAWPPEIDIFEFFTTSNTDRFRSTQHWGQDPHHPMQGADHLVCRPADFFHIYACEWTATQIRWYYDNHLVRIATNGISDFVYPMDVIVNAGIQEGSGLHPENSSYPNFFEVDYIRAYQR